MPLIGGAYTAWGGSGVSAAVTEYRGRSMPAAATLLLGATLPLMSRWVETTPSGVSWMGFFYGGNIGGAVIGTCLPGYICSAFTDSATATFVAVVLNVVVALLGFGIAKATSYVPAAEGTQSASPYPNAWAVYVAIGLSGMTALAPK